MKKRWRGIFQGLLVAYDPEQEKNLVTNVLNTGVLNARVPTIRGWVANFNNSTGQYVTVDRSMIYGNVDKTRSIFAFVTNNEADVDSPIFDTLRNGSRIAGQHGGVSFLLTSGKGRMMVIDSDGDQQFTTADAAVGASGTPFTVAGTWDGTVGSSSIVTYVNGVTPAQTYTTGGTPTNVITSSAFSPEIGRRYYAAGTQQNYDGSIFYVLVWDRTLSAQEIAWLHENRYDLMRILRERPVRVPVTLSEARRPPLVPRRTKFGGDPLYHLVVSNTPFRGTKVDYAAFSRSTVSAWLTYDTVGFSPRGLTLGGAGHVLTGINALAPGTGEFTYEYRVRATTVTNQGIFHLSASVTFPGGTAGLALAHDGTNWTFYANNTYYQYAAAIQLGRDYHVALQRRAGVTELYVDGVRINSVADSTNYTQPYMLVGGYYSTSFRWNGNIADFRATVGRARYAGNFTPPAPSLPTHGVTNFTTRIPTYMKSESRKPPVLVNPIPTVDGDKYFINNLLVTPLKGTLADYSIYRTILDPAPNIIDSNDQSSILTDNGLYMWQEARRSPILIPQSSGISQLGSGDFTIEVEFNITKAATAPNGRAALLSGPEAGSAWFLSLIGNPLGSTGFKFGTGVSTAQLTYSTAIEQDKWHTIKIYRKGTALYGILDGKIVVTGTSSTNYSNSNYMMIGSLLANSTNFDDFYKGYIRRIRITKGIARVGSTDKIGSYLPTHGVAGYNL